MRCTPEEVRILMGGTDTAENTLAAYIATANTLVNGLLANVGLADEVLTEIEKHIAAHFVTAYINRMAKRQKAGEAEVEYYEAEMKQGLYNTPYGQTAMLLDVSGTLTIMFEKKAALLAVKQR